MAMKTLDTETNIRTIIKTAHNDSVTINLPKILMLHKRFSLSEFNSQETNKQRTADVIMEWPDGDPEKKKRKLLVILLSNNDICPQGNKTRTRYYILCYVT